MAEFTEFVRQPFKIEAVQITNENMEELATLLKSTVETTEDGKSQYIAVNRKTVPQGSKAYVGWWVTKMGKKLRCYPNKIFTQQFTNMTDEWRSWFGPEDDGDQTVAEHSLMADDAKEEVDESQVEARDAEHATPEELVEAEVEATSSPVVAESTPTDPAASEGDSGAESVPDQPPVAIAGVDDIPEDLEVALDGSEIDDVQVIEDAVQQDVEEHTVYAPETAPEDTVDVAESQVSNTAATVGTDTYTGD